MGQLEHFKVSIIKMFVMLRRYIAYASVYFITV